MTLPERQDILNFTAFTFIFTGYRQLRHHHDDFAAMIRLVSNFWCQIITRTSVTSSRVTAQNKYAALDRLLAVIV